MKLKALIILFILISSVLPGWSELYPKMGTLTVNLQGVESNEGTIRLELFDSKDRWMNSDRAVVTRTVQARAGKMVVELQAPLGRRYALSVHHDVNNNQKMDTGFPIPKPTEPVGASNFTGNSIPRFYECSFRFNKEPLAISVELRRP